MLQIVHCPNPISVLGLEVFERSDDRGGRHLDVEDGRQDVEDEVMLEDDRRHGAGRGKSSTTRRQPANFIVAPHDAYRPWPNVMSRW
jgi:hypothetical protein